jgi:cell division protein FtsW
MVFNTTSAEVLNKSLEISTHFALIKQIIYAICGVVLGIFIWYVGYHKIIQLSPFLLLGCIIMLILVFIPKIGLSINGARRWISFARLTLQPSEFTKFIIPMCFIYFVTKNKSFLTLKEFLKIIAFFSVPICLVLIEPDTGTTAIILATLVVLFFLTKIRFVYWALPLMFLTISGSIIAYNMPHVKNRIQIYLHPELDLKGKGHQPYQAKIAVGSGRILGRGLGESLQKLDYLPEARSDYIAAIYAEEMGFVGIIILISLYMCISFAGFSIAIKSKDKKGFYLASILTFLITFQAFLNLGVVSGLLPSKGITLPFFSQGGTSLFVNIIAIFILLSIIKKTKSQNVRKKN